MKKGNELLTNAEQSLAPRLEAIIVLLTGNLTQASGPLSAATREKAAAVLVSGGMSMEKAAKLVSLKKSRVVSASKEIKI